MIIAAGAKSHSLYSTSAFLDLEVGVFLPTWIRFDFSGSQILYLASRMFIDRQCLRNTSFQVIKFHQNHISAGWLSAAKAYVRLDLGKDQCIINLRYVTHVLFIATN